MPREIICNVLHPDDRLINLVSRPSSLAWHWIPFHLQIRTLTCPGITVSWRNEVHYVNLSFARLVGL